VLCQQQPIKLVNTISTQALIRYNSNLAVAPVISQKRVLKRKHVENPNVIAFSTCDEYNLESLLGGLTSQGLYEEKSLPLDIQDEALHVAAKYRLDEQSRDVFFFREGTVVFWNFTQTEANSVMQFLRKFEKGSYKENIVRNEQELMEFGLHQNKSKLANGKILLSEIAPGGVDPLEMYTFSNGIALSVKLAVMEATLDEYIESIETVIEDIRNGRKINLTRERVFMKTGELFSLRHKLNLSSDLLDTPDFYWDREQLETLFAKTTNFYAIERRTKVMNEKIQHCTELMELIAHHLEDNHHVRLELMIIILIVVEVMFEIVHYVERFTH